MGEQPDQSLLRESNIHFILIPNYRYEAQAQMDHIAQLAVLLEAQDIQRDQQSIKLDENQKCFPAQIIESAAAFFRSQY